MKFDPSRLTEFPCAMCGDVVSRIKPPPRSAFKFKCGKCGEKYAWGPEWVREGRKRRRAAANR